MNNFNGFKHLWTYIDHYQKGLISDKDAWAYIGCCFNDRMDAPKGSKVNDFRQMKRLGGYPLFPKVRTQ